MCLTIRCVDNNAQDNAPELFLVADVGGAGDRKIVGFAVGTLAQGDTLTEESMDTHVPTASSAGLS